MPVNLLFCEGVAGSPDIRVLSTLLQGFVGEVRPSGPKYGLGHRIRAHREVMQTSRIAGIIDGDFVGDWPSPEPDPKRWVIPGNIVLGWRWRRKEIENYLIDPIVVVGALGEGAPNREVYGGLLTQAADTIAIYQAARTALSLVRTRFEPLPDCWGPPRTADRHPFPPDISDAACRGGIETTVTDHAIEQTVTVEQAIDRYEQLLPDFAADGIRRQDYLSTFAGKDLLIGMDAGLRNLGFQSSSAFREKIVLGIEKAGAVLARTWITEWAALATAVEHF